MVTSIGEDRGVTEPRPTVPALLARSVREFGQETYVVTPTDRLTYEEADSRSADVARRLLNEGVGKGTRVGLFFANDIDWIVWWLAVSRIGALAVPMSTLYPPAELAKVLRLADIGLLVAPNRVLNIDVAERFEAAVPELKSQSSSRLCLTAAPYLRRILLTADTERRWATRWNDDTEALVPQAILSALEQEVSPADPAVMVHTSGSTADPKGVVHTHGTLVRQTSTWPSAIRSVTGSGSSARSFVRCRSSGSVGCLPPRVHCTNPSPCWSCLGSTPPTRWT
jgi:acyl-CoA synthetase (AMP-forming)/AMP-acid ligase II